MKVGDLCSPQVVTAEPGASLREAALAMRNQHVGALIVVERKDGVARPVGNRCQQSAGNAVTAKGRSNAQRENLCIRSDRHGDHEAGRLMVEEGQHAENAGHREEFGQRAFTPGIVETACVQGGRDRKIEWPERPQDDDDRVIAAAAHGRRHPILSATEASRSAGRTSGARRYIGRAGNASPLAERRTAAAATCGAVR